MPPLSIYLIKESIRTAENALSDLTIGHEVKDNDEVYGKIFVKDNESHLPKWTGIFYNYVDFNIFKNVKSISAVFFVSVEKRLFAITFGHGRFLLKQDSYEERFGLLVTINSLRSDSIRSIDKRGLIDDQNSRVQSSQASTASAFGINVERDLVRGIVGYPHPGRGLGKRLAGSDSLIASVDIEMPQLKGLLANYLASFNSKSYLPEFSWIDQIKQVKNKGTLTDRLDFELIQKLKLAWNNNGLVDSCWLSIPDLVEWSRVDGFKFTHSRKEGVRTDLHLPGLVHTFPNIEPSIEFLKTHSAFSVDEEERPVDKWPIYKCIQCEVELDQKKYVLSSGQWFEVDNDFTNQVENFYKDIPLFEENLPTYNHEDEKKYNEYLATTNPQRWCLMDAKHLKVGGVYDKFEFCDAYGNKTLLHVKHYGSSKVLGHLFNQGLVSGELLKSHAKTVSLANKKLSASHQLNFADAIPRDVSGYKIIFAIISQSREKELHLPFFSKVVLKDVTTRLRELGYMVLMKKIECDDGVRVIKLKSAHKKKRKKPA